MAALNLAGKTSGYIKLKSPDVALNATVELPNKDGILATLDDIGTGGGGSVETVNAPAFSVHIGNTPQSIPSTSWVQVNLDDVKFDSHNAFNTSNSRFTPTVAGYYQVTAYAYFIDAQNASMVRIEKNGTEIKRGTRAGSNGTAYSIASLVTALVYMNGTTDYLTMGAYHSDTQPRNINSNAYFEGVLVKPANSGTLVGGDPVTLDALGIPNHDKVTVDESGRVNINTDTDSIWGGGVIQSLGVEGRIVNKHTGGDATLIWRTDNGGILAFATGDTRKDLGGISTDGTNLYFNGLITRTSQVEGLDKKLAIKDKLIEELSARLDKLEKRLK